MLSVSGCRELGCSRLDACKSQILAYTNATNAVVMFVVKIELNERQHKEEALRHYDYYVVG